MSQYGDSWEDWQDYLDDQIEKARYPVELEYDLNDDPPFEPGLMYRQDVSWTPKFSYPRSFNNYDAWMAECYAKNEDGTIDYTKGVMARVAEKEGIKVLSERYKFSEVRDTNLEIALERKLSFNKHLLSYDIEAIFKHEDFKFDVKSRIFTNELNFYINLSKVQPEEFFLFARMSGTRTLPITQIVGFLTPNMVEDYFGHLSYDVASFPGYFLFNNTLEAFEAYQKIRNPTEVPLKMQWVEKALLRNPDYYVSREFLNLVNEYQDYSNNPDVAKWKVKISKKLR